jgi:hypothetical protein
MRSATFFVGFVAWLAVVLVLSLAGATIGVYPVVLHGC